MPTVSASALVQATPEEVFDFLADYRNIPRVHPQFTGAHLTTGFEKQEGATVELVGRFHGVPMRVHSRIITYRRPSRLVSITGGTVLSRSIWELEPEAGGDRAGARTRARLTVDYKVDGALGGLFTGIAAPVLNRELGDMTAEALRRLAGLFSGPEPA